MRPLKIAAVVMAALLASTVLAAVALLLLVDPNHYRGDIERITREKLGRPLRIGGPLHLKIFPWLAISIADVTLGNPPGYGNQPFVQVHQASVGVKLLPLLGRRLEVSRLAVEGLTVNLVSRSAEDNNWRDLGGSGQSQSPGGGSGGTASIAAVDFRNASLSLRDETKKTTTTLSGLQVHTGRLGSGGEVPVSVAFDYGDGGKAAVAHFSVRSRVELPNGAGPVRLSDLALQGQWFGTAPQAGKPLAFSVSSAAVAFDTHTQALAPATLVVKVGDLSAQLSASGERMLADRVVSGKITLGRSSVRKALASLGATLPVTRDPHVLDSFALGCDFSLTPQQLQLAGLSVTLDDTHLQGVVGLTLDSLALSYTLKVDSINVDRYLVKRPDKSVVAVTNRAPPPPSRLPVDLLRKLNLRGTLQMESVVFDGLTFTAVTLPLTAAGGQVHLGPATAHLLGGDYNGDTVLDARPARVQLSLNEHVKAIDVGALMKTAFDTARVSGHGDADAVLNGAGNTDADILRSLAGKIDFNIKAGAINGVDLWYELRRARAVLKRAAIPARTGPERTVFNTLSGSGNLNKGILRNDDLNAATDYLKVRGRGTLDLGANTIDYRVVTQLYQLPAEGAGSEMQDLRSAEIPFKLSGSLQSMSIRPDIEALAQAQLRQEVNQRLQGKQEELKKQLADKLRGLLGR